eukprot:scpid36765/ scgid11051/ 
MDKTGHVQNRLSERSYTIDLTPGSSVRRNRRHPRHPRQPNALIPPAHPPPLSPCMRLITVFLFLCMLPCNHQLTLLCHLFCLCRSLLELLSLCHPVADHHPAVFAMRRNAMLPIPEHSNTVYSMCSS